MSFSKNTLSQSKKVPDVFWFYPWCENQIAKGNSLYFPNQTIIKMAKDVSTLVMFLTKPMDIVLVENQPSKYFLESLQAHGFHIPQFFEIPQLFNISNTIDIGNWNQQINKLQPWGWDFSSKKFIQAFQSFVQFSYCDSIQYKKVITLLFSKSWSVEQFRKHIDHFENIDICCLEEIGISCSNMEAFKKTVCFFEYHHFKNLFIKSNFSTSGQGKKKWNKKNKPLQWVKNQLQQKQVLVLEPFLNKQLDISFHFDIQTNKKIIFLGATRFFTSDIGKFQGAILGNLELNLNIKILKFIQKQSNSIESMSKCLVSFLTKILHSFSYEGPLSIDSMIYKNRFGKLKWKPIVEMNPRWTMGRVTLELNKYISHSCNQLQWKMISLKEINKRGFSNFEEWSLKMKQKYPFFLLLTELSLKKEWMVYLYQKSCI